MEEHHPRHRFDPNKARSLLSPARRLIDDPAGVLREMGVASGWRVGDFGCGPGFFTAPLLEVVGASGRVVALDAEPRMLALLQASLAPSERVQMVTADVGATGLASASLDGVLFAFTLHEVASLSALREAQRVLVSGGRVVALEWGSALCPERGDGLPAGPPMDHRLPKERLTAMLEEVGFQVTMQGERLGGCQYWVHALKP